MKNLILSIMLGLFALNIQAQNFKSNDCPVEFEITFLDRIAAEKTYDDHVTTSGYLNLIISTKRQTTRSFSILHRGQVIDSSFDFSNAIKTDQSLSSTFNVVIGIDNNAKTEALSDLLCWVNDFFNSNRRYSLGKVEIYHFDY